ncbi:hypothetical protein CRM22_006570 [Opisthorchis felineus]|uniref:Uncharacterized protein n=1 Tax=Opisthorchis felineus TaxID=147828 RepID=A0A4S2LK65_OPIFE|nr:hypothetical protein CRM22_006570 [Opisthorchis felineus]
MDAKAEQETMTKDSKKATRDLPNPCYMTTNSEYGKYCPNVHTMPGYFYPLQGAFTQHLGKCGMYRNHSLNT